MRHAPLILLQVTKTRMVRSANQQPGRKFLPVEHCDVSMVQSKDSVPLTALSQTPRDFPVVGVRTALPIQNLLNAGDVLDRVSGDPPRNGAQCTHPRLHASKT